MPPSDARQREQALETARSFIVQAPAGSGKTELLIQRYLALLAVVDQPEAIVAITFTKKAAAEMRARVLKALAASQTEPIAEHERVTRRLARAALERDAIKGWRLRESPSRMRIETFDALCLSIAARMPWMARLGALPTPTEKPRDLYADAARRTVEMVMQADPPAAALRRLLLHFDNDAGALVSRLIAMLEKREQWLPITGSGQQDMSGVRARLEQSIEDLISESLAHVRGLIVGDLAASVVRFGCRNTGVLPAASLDHLPAWIALAELLLTEKGQWRRKVDKNTGYLPHDPLRDDCIEFLKSLAGRHEELRQELSRIRTLPLPRFEEEQWRILCAVFEVLPVAAAQLDMTFAQKGQSDFTRLLFGALDALGDEENPTELALAMGTRIEHVLVDEFQDTSRTQLRLLKQLTAGWEPEDGRTLFLVGDPMQSIYRFRQAEVGNFLDTRNKGIGHIYPETLTLTENFRSQRQIVAWVNGVLSRILAGTEDALTGAVPYVPFTPGVEESGPKPQVHAFFDDARDEEAARVVSLIPDEGATAILVRARSHLPRIITALRAAKIPFRAIDIYQLGERPIVQDLMALTFALLHPADRVSWLAVLRAPWCGLTLADLLAITPAERTGAIWPPPDAVTGDAAARIHRIRPSIERALAERGRRTLRELVEGAWRLLDGPAFAESETDLDDAAAFFDLLETLDEGGDLARFDELRNRVKELFARPDADADDRLQVMTIHQAKGLQFDTVILPGLGANARIDDPPLLAFYEFGSDGLLVAAKPEANQDRLYRFITQQEALKADNEAKRQLYVAVTRARRSLHLLGCASVKQTHEGVTITPASRSFLKLLWDDVETEFQRAFAARSTQGLGGVQPVAQRHIRRLDLAWRAPAPAPAVQWEREQEPAVEERPVTFEWVGDKLRHIGTVLHNWLQCIAESGVERWDAARIGGLDGAFRSALAGLGVSPSDLDSATHTVSSTLLNCLNNERMRWALSRHAEAECEYSLTAWMDGRYRRIRIDRTFVDEAGVRWLIDYKTSAHEGGSRAAFLENEQRRYREQLERYARITSELDHRPVKLALCFPLLGEWVEWSVPLTRGA